MRKTSSPAFGWRWGRGLPPCRFAGGLILAVTYNYAAQWLGGVIFEKETVPEEEQPGEGI
jgi:hypothetical protein